MGFLHGPSFGLRNPLCDDMGFISSQNSGTFLTAALGGSAEEARNRSTGVGQVMAGTLGSDSQKQLLTLIRNFATEKSQGERRILSLKKRIEELRSEAEIANAELEDTKRAKETAEQELKGYEVELALSETSIQSLKSRISLIQDEISSVGSDLEALKSLVGDLMYFGETRDHFYFESKEGNKLAGKELNGVPLSTLEDMLDQVISQTSMTEEEYLAEQNIQKQDTQKELIDCERNVSLTKVILKTTQALQDLTRYPYRKFMAKCLLLNDFCGRRNRKLFIGWGHYQIVDKLLKNH
ncbi:hypothetical protein L484_013960 [Morus notabilis]|uniref:Uncharacterized protein n=1 Tax=Morus notabilis TaxID=981085 RepID=W9QML2_9ROSA|nr:hypothetical protein L484_013960 [Morus notabilis]